MVSIYTPQEVADVLQVNVEFIYDQCTAGRLPHVRLGRKIRIRAEQLDSYLEANSK